MHSFGLESDLLIDARLLGIAWFACKVIHIRMGALEHDSVVCLYDEHNGALRRQ